MNDKIENNSEKMISMRILDNTGDSNTSVVVSMAMQIVEDQSSKYGKWIYTRSAEGKYVPFFFSKDYSDAMKQKFLNTLLDCGDHEPAIMITGDLKGGCR